MKNLLKTTLFAAMILGGIFPIAVFSEDKVVDERTSEFASVLGSYRLPDPVGTINGREISKKELNNFLLMMEGVEIDEVNDPFILMQLLRLRGGKEALFNEAVSRGLDKNAEYQKRLQFVSEKLLIDLLQRDLIAKNELNLDAVKAEYEQSQLELDQHEYMASQILVETEEEAQAIIDSILRKETTFAKAVLAANNKFSEGDGYSGSLGEWFTESMIDADFGTAMKKLQKGEMTSAPVKTEYGYHVIVLDDVREVTHPTFESLGVERIYQLAQPALSKYVEAVQESIKIELPEEK